MIVTREKCSWFGVFGIQSDGALIESGNRGGSSLTSSSSGARESADLSQDYVFLSKGRLTDFGYEIEVSIPFKSLRFQSTATQTWGLNVVRRVQRSNYEDTWAPAVRGNASFLAQSGTLKGLTVKFGTTFEIDLLGRDAPLSGRNPGREIGLQIDREFAASKGYFERDGKPGARPRPQQIVQRTHRAFGKDLGALVDPLGPHLDRLVGIRDVDAHRLQIDRGLELGRSVQIGDA